MYENKKKLVEDPEPLIQPLVIEPPPKEEEKKEEVNILEQI